MIELYTDHKLSLRAIHFDLVLTLHLISLSAIPIVLATTRPATRLDVNGFFEQIREIIPSSNDGNSSNHESHGPRPFLNRLRLQFASGDSHIGAMGHPGADDMLHILNNDEINQVHLESEIQSHVGKDLEQRC